MNHLVHDRRPFTAAQGLTFFAALLIGSAISVLASEDATGGTTVATTDHEQVEKPETAASEANLPIGKQTKLGLYLTAKEAYEMWKSDPENVMIIDVRTPEEYLYVGHPTMAWKIPLAAQTYEWDAEKGHYPMKILPDFASRVSTVAEPGDTILVMCRSGSRSAMAANQLAEAGFSQVYNIIDGMEGDKVSDSGSVFQGQRLVNGWKNSGCPWTYKLTPDQMVLPDGEE